jgi:hypothetical protein
MAKRPYATIPNYPGRQPRETLGIPGARLPQTGLSFALEKKTLAGYS